MPRIAAFTGGRHVPSARFRVRQYIPALARLGVFVDELIAPMSSYPPSCKWLRPLWGGAALASNIPRVVRSWRYDVSLIQREFISTLVTFETLARPPRVLDVDDAIFLYRSGRSARTLARLADRIICGNFFLAEWFGRWNPHVDVIPTGVDTGRYTPRVWGPSDDVPVIGWIGTSSNFRYLARIEGALRRALLQVPTARLRVVSDRALPMHSLPQGRVDFVRWTEDNEVSEIQSMDIGIMPLQDSAWARGKCSFKMLQYMSCGLPVVVSPVGMNVDVLALGECGIGATSEDHWVEALVSLLKDPTMRARLGAQGRQLAEAHFSLTVLAPRLAGCLGHPFL